MAPIEQIWEESNRTPVLISSGVIILLVAIVDWWTKPYFSLGFFYLFPVLFVAAFLPRWMVALIGSFCALLAEEFQLAAPIPPAP